MARINLICKCGWKFFIPGTTQGSDVTCPNCSEAVPIPGRAPGEEVVSPGMLAARKQMAASRVKLLVGLVVAIVVAVIALVVVLTGKKEIPETDDQQPERRTVRSQSPTPSTKTDYLPDSVPRSETSPSTSKSVTPANTKVDFEKAEKLKRTATECQWLINVAGVVVEILRLRGCIGEADRMTQQMGEFFGKIERCVGELATMDQKVRVEPHMMPGDRIINFAQKDLLAMRTADAANFLNAWLATLHANTLEQCIVSRGPNRIQLYFHFPEETKELLQLTRIPAAAMPDGQPSLPTAAGLPPDGPALVAVPPALANDIRARLLAIHPSYLALIPADDSSRMDVLLKSMRGSTEDLAFLTNRILVDLIGRFEQEYGMFKAKVAELEPKIREATSVDVVYFKDGRKIDGKVEENTPDYVKIKGRYGSIKVDRAQIARVEVGKGAGVQFPDRLKAAQGKVPDLVVLMSWCKENGLKVEKEYVGYLILTTEPLNDKVRVELSLPRTLAGVPIKAGPGPVVDPNPAGRNEAVLLAVDALAKEVMGRVTSLTEVINSMRSQTELHRYSNPVAPPEKSAPCLRWINNPLTFNLSDVPAASAIEVGTWWGGLGPEDRKEFAKFFGLWCAYQRYQQKK